MRSAPASDYNAVTHVRPGGRAPRFDEPMTRRAFTIAVLLSWTSAGADDVPDALMIWYNGLAQKAEAALKTDGPQAAIRIYEDALLDPRGEFGRVHLRLGQLYQQISSFAPAASHFRACDADGRVDAMDRELICQDGYRATTAVLTINGLPPKGRVVVVEPVLFAGPFESGGRLPQGEVHLEVETPGRRSAASVVALHGDTEWTAVLGPPRTEAAPIPSDFITSEAPPPEPAPPSGGRATWPYFVAAGVAAGMVGGGLYLGFDSKSQLDDTRDRQIAGTCGAGLCRGDLNDAKSQAGLADGLWMGGVAVAAGTALLWLLLAEDAPAGETP